MHILLVEIQDTGLHWQESFDKSMKNKMYYLIKGEEIVLHSDTTLKILEIETVNKC